MKKLLIVAGLAFAAPAALTSCGVAKHLKTVQQISNVSSTANEVARALGINLGLSGKQQSSVAKIFTDYITATNSLTNLKGKNYLNQLSGLNFDTMGKLKGLMSSAQYLKLLNLGTGKNAANTLLGNLGGTNLSSEATSVLAGLLLNNIR